MKLIGSLTSPFVRKVRIVLAEKKIEYDLVIDSPWEAGTQVPQSNPLGKVPVLVLDDGSSLFDSRVIVEYLDNVAPNNRLLPAPNRERIQVKRVEALADGVCDAAAAAFLEGKREPERCDDAWITRQRDKVVRGLQMMSDDLGTHTWFHGNGIGVADIAVGCALGYLDFRFPDINWKAAHPNLAKLFQELSRRQAFIDTVPRV